MSAAMNSPNLKKVHILGTGSFLPGPPVPVDEIASRLGRLDEAPAAVRNFDSGPGPRMAHESGIRLRHFAIDPETGDLTHDHASLAAEACVRALDQAGIEPNEVDLLAIAAPAVDGFSPPTSARLQAKLGIERCAEFAVHSNCSGVAKAVQIALDAIRLGRCETALVAYSQLSSLFLRSAYLNQPAMTKSQALMRWILSDAAGAMVLQAAAEPDAPGHELVDAYVTSFAGTLAPAMTCDLGARAFLDPGSTVESILVGGRHHLDQDFTAVKRLATPVLDEIGYQAEDQWRCKREDFGHYILSVPTLQLYEDARARLPHFPWGRAPFRGAEYGYCGGASILVQLDQMARGDEFKAGDLIAAYAVESSHWMGGGFLVRW